MAILESPFWNNGINPISGLPSQLKIINGSSFYKMVDNPDPIDSSFYAHAFDRLNHNVFDLRSFSINEHREGKTILNKEKVIIERKTIIERHFGLCFAKIEEERREAKILAEKQKRMPMWLKYSNYE